MWPGIGWGLRPSRLLPTFFVICKTHAEPHLVRAGLDSTWIAPVLNAFLPAPGIPEQGRN